MAPLTPVPWVMLLTKLPSTWPVVASTAASDERATPLTLVKRPPK